MVHITKSFFSSQSQEKLGKTIGKKSDKEVREVYNRVCCQIKKKKSEHFYLRCIFMTSEARSADSEKTNGL